VEIKSSKKNDRSARVAQARTLPPGVAEISMFHGPLPSWYRYDVGLREAEVTPRRAFEMLVSAACFLAIHHGSETAHDRDACGLLKHCSRQLRDTVADMSSAPEEMEALIWQDKTIRWRRHRTTFPNEEIPQRAKTGAVKRWLHRWKGAPKVVAL
jgi:hypothetical protein